MSSGRSTVIGLNSLERYEKGVVRGTDDAMTSRIRENDIFFESYFLVRNVISEDLNISDLSARARARASMIGVLGIC